MEDKYRNHIRKNSDDLIRFTDYKTLLNACLSQGLISNKMRHTIESYEPILCGKPTAEEVQNERHKRLFEKLTRRGPDAYQHLKTILSELQCEEAVKLLNKPHNDDARFQSINPHHPPKRLPSWVGHPPPKTVDEADESPGGGAAPRQPLQLQEYSRAISSEGRVKVIKSKALHSNGTVDVYPMRTQHSRGVFFMVNIIDFPIKEKRRNGAEKDSESLLYLFQQLGFKLFAYDNLEMGEFFKLLTEIINSQYTRDAECFVLALMTHGDMDANCVERVEFRDGGIAKVRDIEDRFQNPRCANLVNKPKILIFPFCRGADLNYGHFENQLQTDSIANTTNSVRNTMPPLSDIIVCNASTPGCTAYRDSEDGSWYIQKFCELMAKHAHNTDFENILKKIQGDIVHLRTSNGGLQVGCYTNIGFNKSLYFNPGYWA